MLELGGHMYYLLGAGISLYVWLRMQSTVLECLGNRSLYLLSCHHAPTEKDSSINYCLRDTEVVRLLGLGPVSITWRTRTQFGHYVILALKHAARPLALGTTCLYVHINWLDLQRSKLLLCWQRHPSNLFFMIRNLSDKLQWQTAVLCDGRTSQ